MPQPVSLIGFTGGEPFMNPGFIAILEETLGRGFETLTLTNALKPIDHRKPDIIRLANRYGSACASAFRSMTTAPRSTMRSAARVHSLTPSMDWSGSPAPAWNSKSPPNS